MIAFILIAITTITLMVSGNEASELEEETYYNPMQIHYSAEREEYLRQERIKEEQEAEELHNSRVIYAPGDLDGFREWEIPEEYQREGGDFPVDLQKWLYCNCRDKGFDYPTALALIETESGWQKDIVGEAGDTGYMQVIARYNQERMEELGATDLTDPYDNIKVGVAYLGELLEMYDGNYGKSLTAYNCGPNGAYRYYFSAGVDTNRYARKILARAEEIREELEER